MGLFKRMGSMIRGFFSKVTGNIEEKNPDLLLEDVKNKIEKARREAEKNIVDIQTNAELERMEIKTHEKNLESIRNQIKAAVDRNERDLLIDLLVREEDEKRLYEMRKESHAEAVREALKIRDEYKMFESEMNSRMSEIRELKSRARMAALKESIVKLDEKYSGSLHNSDINENMEKAREIVNRKSARAEACKSLREDSTEYRIKRLDASVAREKAIKRADELLASHQSAL